MNPVLQFNRFPTTILVATPTNDPTAQFVKRREYGKPTARLPGVTNPSMLPEGLRFDSAGRITSYGIVLSPSPVNSQAAILSPNEAQETHQPASAVFDPANYGEEDDIPITFAVAGDLLVLPRPNQTRILLLIQNLTVAGGIAYAFNKPATINVNTTIIAGGNRLWDKVVPQGDLHVAAAGAGNIVISYINTNIR